MPISQDRIKQLIDAAQSITATHIGQCETLGRYAADFRAGRITLEQLLQYVETRAMRPDAAIAPELTIINREYWRWYATHNKNRNEAERIARRREEQRRGLPKGSLTPQQRVYKKQQPVQLPVALPLPTVHSTDALQVQADSDLFESNLSPAVKAEIDQQLRDKAEEARILAELGLAPDGTKLSTG